MISVGIDVSEGKSTVCGMKPGGEILYTPFEILHTKEDLLRLISSLQDSGEDVRVVLESAGYYHCPVVCSVGGRNIHLCRQLTADEKVLLAKYPQGENRPD